VDEPDPPFTVEPTVNNHLAWVRTLLGLQRTHMAAARTSVALIGFGFSVAEVFRVLQNRVPEHLRLMGPHAPRDVGLVLIGTGVISLAMFTWQYQRATRYLRSPAFAPIVGEGWKALAMPVRATAATIIAIGVLAFGAVLIRL
jgi:putative membrane protein